METITIQKEEYQDLLNKINHLENQTVFLESQYFQSDIFQKNFCALMSEKNLSENWLSQEDEEAFGDLASDEFLDSLLIK